MSLIIVNILTYFHIEYTTVKFYWLFLIYCLVQVKLTLKASSYDFFFSILWVNKFVIVWYM